MKTGKDFDRDRASPYVLVTTSWDDGHPTDLKLGAILSEFGIKGTIYISPHNRQRNVMSLSDLRSLSEHFEIGSHTLTHPDLTKLNEHELESEVKVSKTELEDALGKSVQMFCYPRGLYNKRVRRAVMDAGFAGARTTKQFIVHPGDDAWEMPTTIMVDPLPHWVRLRHELRTGNWNGVKILWQRGLGISWVELACSLFEDVLLHGGVWHLWGHSWEIEKHNLWDELRAVLRYVAHRERAIYISNCELTNYI